MYVFYDGVRNKSDSVVRFFLVCFLWWSKRKNLFSCNIIFFMLSMMKQKKKLILFQHYFLYDFYDVGREKIHTVITLVFAYFLWWSKKKNLFSCNIMFCMFSMMKQNKKFALLQHYFLYDFYDVAREKVHSVITLVFVCCLWWRKRKNSFSYNIIFCMLSMVDQEKNVILLQHYFFYNLCDGLREKTHSVRILFFVCCLWWTKGKHSFCYNIFFWTMFLFCYTIIFFMFSMMEREKKLLLL